MHYDYNKEVEKLKCLIKIRSVFGFCIFEYLHEVQSLPADVNEVGLHFRIRFSHGVTTWQILCSDFCLDRATKNCFFR